LNTALRIVTLNVNEWMIVLDVFMIAEASRPLDCEQFAMLRRTIALQLAGQKED